MSLLAWIVASCVLGTAISLALAALVAYRVDARWISSLVAYAVGALLGAAFLDVIPHIFESAKQPPGRIAAFLLLGILIFFVLEKLLLWRHHHHHSAEDQAEAEEMRHSGHDHGRSGWMILFGDAFHNFTDGAIIAGAFLADVKVGVVTSIAIIAHEIPQEIGDFVVLIHSGFTKARALLWNAVSGGASVAGGVIAYFAFSAVSAWIPEILALAASSMIYVAVADLIPGLHRRTALRESLTQVIFIVAGVGSIWSVHALLFPEA